MTRRLRALLPALVTAAVLAGCGTEDIDGAQERIDRTQDQIERGRDAVEDPAGAARREADRALDRALPPAERP